MRRRPWIVLWPVALFAGCAPAPTAPPPPLDAAAPARTETASFGLGWFWESDSQFGGLPGVVRTRVGYAGGRKASPTYDDLGDHTETVQVDFDPAQTSYGRLLEVFMTTDNRCGRAGTRQYMSAVFYHDEAQKKLAVEALRRQGAAGTPVVAAVLPVGTFYPAEDYHQKYLLRRDAVLVKEFKAMYPDAKAFRNSSAAARVNGYLGGHGSKEVLQQEIDRLGLSPEAKQRLLRYWERGAR